MSEKQLTGSESISLDIDSITSRIINSADKNICVPPPKKAGKPEPGLGFTSEGNPEKRECEEVPEGYIPLLPLRFALNDDSIINSKYQDYIYPAMPQIQIISAPLMVKR
jgi:hypothetical protein